MVFKNWMVVALIAVCALQTLAQGVTTMHFQNKYYSASRTFINPYNNTVPGSDITTFAVNNIVSPASEKFVISNLYDGLPYTGLSVPSGYQSILTSGGSPRVGNSLVQAYGSNSGLYMNLAQVSQYPFGLPNSSMQMVYNFKTPPMIWAVASDTMFCASGKMDLHNSVLGSNPNLSNQLNIAFIFRDNSTGKEFWYSFALYESRPTVVPDDFVMLDNPDDTGLPIVISFAKKQGGIGRYSRDIPNYGNPMRAYYSGANIPGMVDVGGCIQRDQFLAIINQVKKYSAYANLSTNLSNYSVKHFNIDIEIAHNYTKDRSMGLSVNQFWIYNVNYPIKPTPQYGFFYGGNQNTLYACNVSSSRVNMGGWVDQGNGCFHQYVPQLINTNLAASCTDRRSFCNSNNKIEEVACGCPGGMSPVWKLNQERNSDGGVYRTCYRYETAISCIY